MKKLFTLMFAMVAVFSASAANLELLFGTTPVVSGSTYETGYKVEAYDLGGSTLNVYEQVSNLYLRGVKDTPVTVEVTATQDVNVCSITGQCTTGTKVTKSGKLGAVDVVSTSGDMVTIDLRIDKSTSDMTGAAPSSIMSDITVNVVAYATSDPSQRVSCTVVMRNKSQQEIGGVQGVSTDGYYVNVIDGNVLRYNVIATTQLRVFDVNGRQVKNIRIFGQGTTDLSDLPAGMYIYTTGQNSGKILVK